MLPKLGGRGCRHCNREFFRAENILGKGLHAS